MSKNIKFVLNNWTYWSLLVSHIHHIGNPGKAKWRHVKSGARNHYKDKLQKWVEKYQEESIKVLKTLCNNKPREMPCKYRTKKSNIQFSKLQVHAPFAADVKY
jgi:hypothetical protein